jgi:hypothetical protein
MPRLTGPVRLALAALLATLATGPAPAQAPADEAAAAKALDQLAAQDKYPLRHDPERARKVRGERVQANLADTLGVFQKTAGASAPWAAKARAAFEVWAQKLAQEDLCGASDSGMTLGAHKAAADAIAAGCDDPLIRYWIAVQDARASGVGDAARMGRLRDAVAALDKSPYPDVLKLIAVHQWAARQALLPVGSPLRADESVWDSRFYALLGRVAKQRAPSADRLVLKLVEAREAALVGPSRPRPEVFALLAKQLEDTGASKYLLLMAEGEHLTRVAWDIRGGGFADTIPAERLKAFREKLEAAKEKLEAAWAEDKTRFEAPTARLHICRGLPADRDAMEVWFARALEANPDNKPACLMKLEYLSRKWHGTFNDHIAFAWMLCKSGNWSGQFGLVPVESHSGQGIAPVVGPTYQRSKEAIQKYYADARVWLTVKVGLEGQLQVSPGNPILRTLYAKVAVLGGRPAVAAEHFEKLGENYTKSYFQNVQDYNECLEAARTAKKK